MIQPRIRVAKRGALLFLEQFGFAAVVMPWRTIYVLEEYRNDAWLIRHECAHLAQMDRDGWLKYWVLTLWFLVWPGYERSPYEIEARSTEQEPDHPLIAGYQVEGLC